MDEAMADAVQVIAHASKISPDGRTVALCFGTIDFLELMLNWVCHAFSVGVHWFALVAMDRSLYAELLRLPSLRPHALLLPRIAYRNRTVTKLTVIGERQRFGLSVLERGFSIVHTDLDAYWLKNPWPLISVGDDVVAERIWGKPTSVVKAWGAAICTGWYYLRSSKRSIALARKTQSEILAKRTRQPGWQASDQYFINIVLHRQYSLRWDHGNRTLLGADSMSTKFTDLSNASGTALSPAGPLRVRLLAHAIVPRACPVLSATEFKNFIRARQGGKLKGKAYWWRYLMNTASVVHCVSAFGLEAARTPWFHPSLNLVMDVAPAC